MEIEYGALDPHLTAFNLPVGKDILFYLADKETITKVINEDYGAEAIFSTDYMENLLTSSIYYSEAIPILTSEIGISDSALSSALYEDVKTEAFESTLSPPINAFKHLGVEKLYINYALIKTIAQLDKFMSYFVYHFCMWGYQQFNAVQLGASGH